MRKRRKRGESAQSFINPNKTVYGKGFAVGKCVCDCYLKSIKVKEDMYEGVEYTKVMFHFLRSDKWVTKYVSIKPAEMFSNERKYKKAKLHAFNSLINIAASYLTKQHIKDLNFATKGFGAKGYLKHYIEALESKKYWAVPVCLKTVPRPDGGVSVGKYLYFIKPQNKPVNWELRYSKWETDQYSKYLLNKNN